MIFNQQQYMGASIRSFNASIGWGGSTSNLSVNLVEDNYYNQFGNLITGETFTPIEVGLPTIFKFSGFNDDELNLPIGTGNYITWQFAGIVKNYTQENSANGNPLFSVNVSDPREILAGTQLILDDYFGSVSGIPNVLNVYGAVEDIMSLNSGIYGAVGTLGNYVNNYGGMQRNPTGTPWKVIRDAVHYMTSGVLSQHYGTFLKLKNRKYTVNLSDLPQTLSSGYRISPTDNMSLMDYVSDVCEAASYDYYVTLNPLYYPNGNTIVDENLLPIGEIKVNTVSRAYLPQPSSIINFIANTSGATVKNIGVEFRNETNAKFLLGGNIHTMYMSYGSGYRVMPNTDLMYSDPGIDYKYDNIHQYLGVNLNGNLIPEFRPDNPFIGSVDNYIGSGQKAESIIVIDTRDVDNDIYNQDIYQTTLDELRSIQTSKEDWENYLFLVSKFKYIPVSSGIDEVNWLTIHNQDPVLTDCVEDYRGLEPENLRVRVGKNAVNITKIYGNKFIVGYGTSDTNQNFWAKDAGNSSLNGFYFDNNYVNKFTQSVNSSFAVPLIANNQQDLTLSTVSIITQERQISKNSVVYDYQKYVLYPVDAEGYTPYIIGVNEDYVRVPHGLFLPSDFIQKWKIDWKIVEYQHTNVLNPHYRKYGRLGFKGGADDTQVLEAITNMSLGRYKEAAKHLSKVNANVFFDEVRESKIQAFYDFLKQFADNYGRKYMVNMPNMLATVDVNTSGIITSYAPADAGFLTTGEYAQAVANEWLPTNYYNLTQEDGRLLPYVIYPEAGLFNFESLNPSDVSYTYYPNGTRRTAFVKCQVNDEFVYVDRYGVNLSGLYPKAVITLPAPVHYKEEVENQYRGHPNFLHLKTLTNISSGNYIGVDSTFEYDGARAIPPRFAAIALKDNTVSYGPWYNIGATGIVSYERDDTLVPWNYGSYSGLDTAARTRISEVAIQQQDENGSVEFPGIPSISLGSQLEWISNNNTYYGPYITDINVDFGEAGVKTNYKMQTWTPKFGKQAKQYEDSVQKFGKEATKARRLAQERAVTGFNTKSASNDSLKKQAATTVVSNSPRKELPKRRQNSSSHHILAGQNTGVISSGQSSINTVVVAQPYYNTQSQITDDYINKSIVSLDAIFRPYSTYNLHSGVLPHYEFMNSGFQDFSINNFDTSLTNFPFAFGHDINVVTSEEELPANSISNNGADYSSDKNYRSLGLMNPMIMVGYGRNINGKPVPNFNSYEYDVSGRYVYNTSGNENSDSYANNYLNRSDMWKAGPLDTRWDSRKKMWVPGSILIEGYLVEDLAAAEGRFSDVPFTSGKMVLCGGTYANVESGYSSKLWDRADASGYYASGYSMSGVFYQYPDSGLQWISSGDYYSSLGGLPASGGNPDLFVLLINRSSQISALSGTYVIASPMPNGDYRPIWVDCETSERLGIE